VAIANPAFVNLIAHGQNSAIALGLFTLAFLALRQGRLFVAGLAIGSLAFKPQLGLVAAFIFVLTGPWLVVLGAALAVTLQFGLAWIAFGTSTLVGYWEWLGSMSRLTDLLWVKPYQMHSLASFWSMLVPWPPAAFLAYALTATVVVGATCWWWKSGDRTALRHALLLVATVLVSPHVYVYDLVILMPALLIAADWSLSSATPAMRLSIRRAIYFSYALPLLSMLAQVTRVQLSVVAMGALAVLLVRALRETALRERLLARSAPTRPDVISARER
jgi:hypothetical protein